MFSICGENFHFSLFFSNYANVLELLAGFKKRILHIFVMHNLDLSRKRCLHVFVEIKKFTFSPSLHPSSFDEEIWWRRGKQRRIKKTEFSSQKNRWKRRACKKNSFCNAIMLDACALISNFINFAYGRNKTWWNGEIRSWDKWREF